MEARQEKLLSVFCSPNWTGQ